MRNEQLRLSMVRKGGVWGQYTSVEFGENGAKFTNKKTNAVHETPLGPGQWEKFKSLASDAIPVFEQIHRNERIDTTDHLATKLVLENGQERKMVRFTTADTTSHEVSELVMFVNKIALPPKKY